MPNFVKTGQSVANILRFFDFSRWQQLPSWIFEIVNFYLLPVSARPIHIIVPDFVKIARSILEILRFFEFQDGRRRYLGFLKSQNFIGYYSPEGGDASLAKFRQNQSFRCGDIAFLRIFKMGAAAILDFRNREILLVIGVQKVETHQYAKFCQNWSIGCEDIKIFQFFKMAAVRHLGFVWGLFGVSTWGLYHSAKFVMIDAVVFII